MQTKDRTFTGSVDSILVEVMRISIQRRIRKERVFEAVSGISFRVDEANDPEASASYSYDSRQRIQGNIMKKRV